MTADRMEFDIDLKWEGALGFTVRWDLPQAPGTFIDEDLDVGGSGRGPNASRLVVAGVANCLSSSLMFCLQKARAEVSSMRVRAHGTILRNPKGRLRLVAIRVEPVVSLPAGARDKLERCSALFEDFCIVTEAVRSGIPVEVQLVSADEAGRETPVGPARGKAPPRG